MCANLQLSSQLIYFRKQTTPVKYCFFTVINQQLAQYNIFVLIFLINGKAALPIQPPVANLINWKHVTSLIAHTFSSEGSINASYIIFLPISPALALSIRNQICLLFPLPCSSRSCYGCGTRGHIEVTAWPAPEPRLTTALSTSSVSCLLPSIFCLCISITN